MGIFVPKSAGVVINAKDLSMMKPDAVIVNPSGYENIDTAALREYLLRNPAARYVFLAMPDEGHFAALCDLPSARLWPLFTGSTVEARQRRRELIIANLREYLEGGGGRNRVIGGRD